VFAEGRIYCLDEQGTTTVLAPGKKFEKLAENKLDDGFMATAAVSGRAMFLRSKAALYRVEE